MTDLPAIRMKQEVEPLISQLKEKGLVELATDFQQQANTLRHEIKHHMPLHKADHQIDVLKGKIYNILSGTSTTN